MGKKTLFIVVISTALALLGLMAVQVHWIRHCTQVHEAQLDHRASMAMWWVLDQLNQDKACIKAKRSDNKFSCKVQCQRAFSHEEVDSLLHFAFAYYKVNLPYSFKIQPDSTHIPDSPDFLHTSLSEEQAEARFHGLTLDVRFRNKTKTVLQEMSGLLSLSGFLLLVLSGGFTLTVLTVFRQKKIAERTTDFLNNLTHEFKTPIATINLAVKMLGREKVRQQPEKTAQYTAMIGQESQKLGEHVERMLELARMERGELNLKREPVCVHDIITEVLPPYELQVQERNGQLATTCHATEAQILGDRTHLFAALSNLLDNANKYSPDAPKITVSTEVKNQFVKIQVRDEGQGMHKNKIKHIFDKFYRAPTGNRHDVKGFGIGLAYVKATVEAHQGEVSVESQVGKGSTFTLSLPLHRTERT